MSDNDRNGGDHWINTFGQSTWIEAGFAKRFESIRIIEGALRRHLGKIIWLILTKFMINLLPWDSWDITGVDFGEMLTNLSILA